MTIETDGSTSRCTSAFVDTNSFVSHPARVTIKHWQLRDLLVKTAGANEVLYVSDRAVRSMDTDSGKTAQVVEFAFEPRCLAAAYGLVAAGGVQRGQLGVAYRGEDANPAISVFELGGFINNSISLFKPAAASVSALVCNNDRTLRLLDLSNSSFTILDTLQLPVPLNHASISPDHKTVIACGDSAQLFMFHPEQPCAPATDSGVRVDSKWEQKATLSTSADAGFSTAFTPSGVLFAVASQDGLASVYDSRYLSTSTSMSLSSFHSAYTSNRNLPKPLKYIESTRPHEGAGAFRCLKFSTGAEDLLLITEQAGRVHVVDARRLEDRQILDIPTAVNYRHRRPRRRRDGPESSTAERRRRPLSAYPGYHYRYTDPLERELEDAEGEIAEDEDVEDDGYCHEFETVRSNRYSHDSSRLMLDPSGRMLREKEISGLAWSDEDGGSIIVGWDSGIGKWSLDRWGRRVFPSYQMR